jgi:hypothetical protein
MLCHQLKVNTAFRCGISTSFITVMKPHMKKSVVSTAMGLAMEGLPEAVGVICCGMNGGNDRRFGDQ